MNSENFKIYSVSSKAILIELIDPSLFDEQFNLGSYLKIPYSDSHDKFVVGIIENYKIKERDSPDGETEPIPPSFIIELELIGTLEISDTDFKFERGGQGIPLPPNNGISLLTDEELKKIFSTNLEDREKFVFSNSITNNQIDIPVNGNKFFNKHFAIVGSTGSGKSHTLAKVLQKAISAKDGEYVGMNNSHIFIFDIHDEYPNAFPESHCINAENLVLPYWLLNSEELQEFFIDTDANDHNQRSTFQEAVTANKQFHFSGDPELKSKIHYDSPLFFDIDEVVRYISYRNSEFKQKDSTIVWIDGEEEFVFNEENRERLFKEDLKIKSGAATNTLNSKFINFLNRLKIKLKDSRLEFLLGTDARDIDFEKTLKQFIGYKDDHKANITILDLSGIPFEVLSITVSLISRILFDFGYYYKKQLAEGEECETPILLVYEEAHKYVPKSSLLKYRSSKIAIERIAKEGRKYGVTLGIVSQRPSEISETIFSQCNNFISMRLTNPDDQNYVKKLLPDTLGNLTDSLSTLQSGEALLIGESIIIPSLVEIEKCEENAPKSNDIKYFEIWKNEWKEIEFDKIITNWKK